MCSDEDWTPVVSKSTKYIEKYDRHHNIVTRDISLERLIHKILKAFAYLSIDIVACFIYGSRARKTNNITSDVDLIVFFKHQFNVDDLKEIKTKLVSDIGLSVDFVAYVWKKKWVDQPDERDACYFDQIKPDAIRIIGTEYLTYLFETSQKLGKVK